ncbi:MAG TPA: cytochrome c peroxidase [Blastocatellia bacterium]|nr:cytochrome c peroxidase [Blastocatellia bacterium]
MKTFRRQTNERLLRLSVVLTFALAAAGMLAPSFQAQQALLKPAIPRGLPADTWDYYVPRNNPMTAAKVELGRKLFFDARLSADGKVACASCHDPKLGFADGKTVAEGIGGKLGARNSPSVLNVMFYPNQFWDGRAEGLEDQAVQPLTNPIEMGNASYDQVVARLKTQPEYVADFRSVFGGDVSIARVGQAIAAFERTLVSGDSPFDRFNAGDQSALGDAAKRGLTVFRGRGRCSRCHTFSEALPFFTDFQYHNTGVAMNDPRFDKLSRIAFNAVDTEQSKEVIDRLAKEPGGEELGRVRFSYVVFDIGAFRTPTLRNIALTAPYFHDGSARTLAEVVKFYNEGGKLNVAREWDLAPLSLTEDEQRDLVVFLESLTDQLPKLPPEQLAGKK